MGTLARTALDTHVSEALDAHGYVAGTLDSELDPPLTEDPSWGEFVDGWNRLPVDRYMADGGTYRLRRFSEFYCDSETGEVTRRPHRTFSQPRDVNYLNGGVERLFEPLQPATAASPVLRRILTWCVRGFAGIHGSGVWHAICFQNRTLARPDEPGEPAPEGVHQDGMDYNVIVLVDRHAVDGGANTIYSAETREPTFDVLLSEPGDFLLNDDRATLHSATPVMLRDTAARGYRDAFVVSFDRVID
jgi:hypothetical protein